MARKITTVSIPSDLYNNAKHKGIKLSKVLVEALVKQLNAVEYYENYDDKIEALSNQKTRLESKIKTLKLRTNNTLNNLKEDYNLKLMTTKQDYEDEMLILSQQYNSVEFNLKDIVKSNTKKILKQETTSNETELELTIVQNIIDHQILKGNDPRVAPDVTDIKLLTADTKVTWKDIDKYWSVSKLKNQLNDIIIERIKINKNLETE